MSEPSIEDMLGREQVANTPKHWVRAVTACNSHCLFCLDSDTPRNVYIPAPEVKAEIARGRDELGAERIVISGGEASLHPQFPEFIAYAKSLGYERVQTVTNGYRFAERRFFDACMEAGLGEVTFSLHGHTEELHDHLTQHPGAFRRIVKAMARTVRDGRAIVNVDICINKQNVGVIDKVIELCISLGVSEFDLLHVIPQAAAFDNRDQLFYDVREHLPTLQKVFRLNRHPRFVVWTNRFPVSYLEGLEDLIQDPHKMLDEVNGRRFQVRRYLDGGDALDCRDKERCPHCFIEPFCTTADRIIAGQNERTFDIWWLGRLSEQASSPAPLGMSAILPFGCTSVGLRLARFAELGPGQLATLPRTAADTPPALYLEVDSAEAIPAHLHEGQSLCLVAESEAQLVQFCAGAAIEGVELEIRLNQSTARWLLANRDLVAQRCDTISLHQPSHEHLSDARSQDIRDVPAFFRRLGLPLRVSGLPACMAPGATLVRDPQRLPQQLFDADTGRLHIRELARYHVETQYRAKSERCADCVITTRCEGAHINMVRDQGLAHLTPFTEGARGSAEITAHLRTLYPDPLSRLATGRLPEPAAASVPGFPDAAPAPRDPLALIGEEQLLRRAKRKRPRSIDQVGGS